MSSDAFGPERISPAGRWPRAQIGVVAALGTILVISGAMLLPAVPQPVAPPVTAPAAQAVPSFADMVERVRPAVVAVRVRLSDASARDMTGFGEPDGERFGRGVRPFGPDLEQFFRRFGLPLPEGRPRQRYFSMSQGSGFFISPDGYLVTNHHVVRNADSVEVTTDDGNSFEARVIGTDEKTDLALLKVDGRRDFRYAELADARPRVGDWVVAVGNPFGLGGTVTAGIVSAMSRDIGIGPYDDFIQIDAPVNRGNSGGPVFDVQGRVVGVTTAIYSPSGGSVGIGFAIPTETVRLVVTQLREHGEVTRAFIGVQIQPVTKDIAEGLGLAEASGALVAEVQPDAPAAQAGIKAGDVITRLDGTPVRDARSLARAIAALKPGSRVELGIVRDGRNQTIAVTLGTLPDERRSARRDDARRPQASAPATLGLVLAPASAVPGAGSVGVVVTQVDPAGPAAERGFRVGDVILEVAGKPVASPQEVREALAAARQAGRSMVLMRVRSEQGTRFVALPLGAA